MSSARRRFPTPTSTISVIPTLHQKNAASTRCVALTDTFGLLIAGRVEPADISDRRAAALLRGGLGALFPKIRTVIADAGHQSRKLARHLLQQDGWKLQIVKRRQRAFKITGLTWIVERSFAWLGRNRRLSKDYEYSVQTSETLIDIAATRLILNRLASA